ncbi:hypothetical protein PIOMA14_I_1702 [Prevotella intermedia]|uniref:Uncharacterized protein n=1 Tax=Prevotella intermedia TaxID=28131 RepID=A0A0S3UL23_PREIN|nr:hypothetical protein PIOMA14_I_1001 [Prevotella intermedia]BAU18210.1 hypothetical protein PIOMA14_I_1702 [Prevotella intermedia]
MKLKVTSAFRDRDDHVTVYDPDTILEVKDKDRAQSLIDRGLCKEFKGKTAPTYILGTEEDGSQPDESEGGTDENPDTGAAGQEQNPNSNPEGDE